MEDADSICFWYKTGTFAQYNIPKMKKGVGGGGGEAGGTQQIFIRVLRSDPLPLYTPSFTIREPLSYTFFRTLHSF